MIDSSSLSAGSEGGAGILWGKEESGLAGEGDIPFGLGSRDVRAESVASYGWLLPVGLGGVFEGGVWESW